LTSCGASSLSPIMKSIEKEALPIARTTLKKFKTAHRAGG
jgi:hypothetical protein